MLDGGCRLRQPGLTSVRGRQNQAAVARGPHGARRRGYYGVEPARGLWKLRLPALPVEEADDAESEGTRAIAYGPEVSRVRTVQLLKVDREEVLPRQRLTVRRRDRIRWGH